MRLKLAGFFVFLFASLFTPLVVFADEEFSTSYTVSYNVGTDGVTQVEENVSLKNLTDKYYASNFTLTIGSTTVSDVTAADDSGSMETSVENKDSKTSITVKFNQQVAGVDKQQNFTLKFKSKDFTQAIGKTWEVNLPKIPSSANISSYDLNLSVPVAFGDPTSISPNPKSQSQNYEKQTFSFTKDQIEHNGVSVNFGTFQLFDFNLKYKLENDSMLPSITSVALPPDTQYQDVLIQDINPKPVNVTIDDDGNFLAWYRVSPRSNEEVSVNGAAKLYISPKNKQDPKLEGKQLSPWLKTDQYWEKDNPAILATLREIFKDGIPGTDKDKAKAIYNYVVDTLQYDSSRINSNNIERLGAVTALNNPKSAVCMEFTDLFIALSRAAGIPAREMDGYAYSQNHDLRPLSLSNNLLHAWPEYYDSTKGWVMVDPTWENTSGGVDYFNKFDLNHLTLAIKGVSSSTPYVSNDVKVSISSNEFKPISKVNVDLVAPQTVIGGLPTAASVKVSNDGEIVQGPFTLILTSGQAEILGVKTVSLGPIPPFGFATYNFNIKTPLTLNNLNDSIKVNVAGQEVVKSIGIRPFFYIRGVPYVLIGLIVLISGIYGLTFAFHLHRKHQAPET